MDLRYVKSEVRSNLRRLSAVTLAFLLVTANSAQSFEIVECLVKPKEIAKLGASARGVIARITADRADRVQKGDILAELEASAEENEIALANLRFENDVAVRLAQAKAETAEISVERLGQLSEKKLVKHDEYEHALLEARTARLEEEEAGLNAGIAGVQLAAAKAALERKRIRAPFDGVIVERVMSVGELYNEQGPIFVIARINPLVIEAWLPAASRSAILPEGQWHVDLESGETVTATLDLADPILDPATGTFGIRLALPNPDGTILAGQSCRLTQPAKPG
ncbi:efflux RND transporter periplasmic adaptor subunit [Pseudorhodobacter sp.]|uniref:efflux RND transporter periplasmic adaptor subunit n=1 Tax=Pseudorhodobacter sp. TaxID=1934400 RepID=UPI00264838C3|nr:efflux RND transporter periplasmic adaptor subunit [Pseudorhodobacter sp.]MDN5788088.1 efflux RND transporter periplasmic adaptor subunit [Pseudorhodobacter sp.]